MTIKKGDTVLVISGRDKGKKGTILSVLPKSDRVVVEGANIRKRHLKPSKTRPRGGIAEFPGSMHRSNVMPIDPASERAIRINKVVRSESK